MSESFCARFLSGNVELNKLTGLYFFLVQALKEAFAQVQLCSRLGVLLLKKKLLNSGDSPLTHAQKVKFSS